MGRYRKILVAVDGSNSSKNAFVQATNLAREYKSWVSVLTAVPEYTDLFQMPSVQRKAERALRDEGRMVLDSVLAQADTDGVNIKPLLKEGIPYECIVETASEGGFDLIIMGRRGKTSLEKALMGGVTARVIGHSRTNVLIFPEKTSIGWKNILLPVDGSKRSDLAFSAAIELAKEHGGRISAVAAVDVTEEFMTEAPAAVEDMQKKALEIVEKVKEKAQGEGVQTDALVGEGDAFRVITDTARKQKADLIVMASHGRTGVRKMLMGSVTEKVIGYASCPVLVVKSK
jgi:nucleotide-binding universal stress UspA family protein